MRQPLLCAALTLAVAALASAAEMVRDIDWAAQRPADKAVTVVAATSQHGSASVRMSNTSPRPRTFTLLVLEKPAIGQASYAITGYVEYENVEGGAYLELWSVFPDGGRYFSRTLAAQGPMAQLHGTGGHWYSLPFQSKPGMYPSKIILNVVLPGKGTVVVGSSELVQFRPDENPLRQPMGWLFGWPGGILAGISMCGMYLGGLGALVGLLAATGRYRRFVMALDALGIVSGVVMLLIGAGFLVLRFSSGYQSSTADAVWSGYLTAGIIAIVVFGGIRPSLRRRYDELELRRMSAQDTA